MQYSASNVQQYEVLGKVSGNGQPALTTLAVHLDLIASLRLNKVSGESVRYALCGTCMWFQ